MTSAADWAKFSPALGSISATCTHLATTGDAFGVSRVSAP